MSDAKSYAKEIFLRALDCATPEELTSYLDHTCAGETALRTRVEELLRARQEAGRFLGGAWSSPTEEMSRLLRTT